MANTNSEESILKKIHEALSTGNSAFSTAEKWIQVLAEQKGIELDAVKSKVKSKVLTEEEKENADGAQVLEGVFDGQNMVAADNQKYPVPANYASKSKLVEGDRLKLIIQPNGAFIFKQIELIPRKLITGKLILDGNQYMVLTDTRSYNVLYASVTFFRANVGDTITITVPEDGIASWAAIENVVPAE